MRAIGDSAQPTEAARQRSVDVPGARWLLLVLPARGLRPCWPPTKIDDNPENALPLELVSPW
jgi:hypothetical protein